MTWEEYTRLGEDVRVEYGLPVFAVEILSTDRGRDLVRRTLLR